MLFFPESLSYVTKLLLPTFLPKGLLSLGVFYRKEALQKTLRAVKGDAGSGAMGHSAFTAGWKRGDGVKTKYVYGLHHGGMGGQCHEIGVRVVEGEFEPG